MRISFFFFKRPRRFGKSLTVKLIFEVITTPHPFLTEWTLRGIYNPDFTPKAHTQQIVDAFKIFKEAWVDLANAN